MYIMDGIINLLCETIAHWTMQRNYITVMEESFSMPATSLLNIATVCQVLHTWGNSLFSVQSSEQSINVPA